MKGSVRGALTLVHGFYPVQQKWYEMIKPGLKLAPPCSETLYVHVLNMYLGNYMANLYLLTISRQIFIHVSYASPALITVHFSPLFLTVCECGGEFSHMLTQHSFCYQ